MVVRSRLLVVVFVLGALSTLGCGRGIDRIETSSATTTAAADRDGASAATAVTAKATLVSACRTAEPDPRTTSVYSRACDRDEAEGCLHLGIAHLCGANGSENGLAAIPLFEKSCQLEDDRGCVLLHASRVVWSRPSAVVSLLDESTL